MLINQAVCLMFACVQGVYMGGLPAMNGMCHFPAMQPDTAVQQASDAADEQQPLKPRARRPGKAASAEQHEPAGAALRTVSEVLSGRQSNETQKHGLSKAHSTRSASVGDDTQPTDAEAAEWLTSLRDAHQPQLPAGAAAAAAAAFGVHNTGDLLSPRTKSPPVVLSLIPSKRLTSILDAINGE